MALFFIISFSASIVGAICGIGGGVIIKPVLDLFQVAHISTINFLSCCTVLSMSCYSITKAFIKKEKQINAKLGTPLAIGAAIGGILGKNLFVILKDNVSYIGAIQSSCLALITLGALIYTINKERIKTKNIQNPFACIIIGLCLGVLSSFLGIGGGPINLVVLYYFFSMNTKTAATNSLYIILFSQITSLLSTIVTNSIPELEIWSLVLMITGGILGGIIGRWIYKKINNKAVDKLFIILMIIIIGISFYNFYTSLR